MSSSGYTAWSVTAGEIPTTAYWNLLGSNDASFNTGNGFNDGAIITRHLASGIQVATEENNPYKWNVYRSASYTYPGVNTIVFDTKLFDTGSNYNVSTGQLTIPVSGFYFMSVTLGYQWVGSSGRAIGPYIRKNGTTTIASNVIVGTYASNYGEWDMNTSGIFQLSAADIITINDGGNTNLACSNTQSDTFFTGFLVSAT